MNNTPSTEVIRATIREGLSAPGLPIKEIYQEHLDHVSGSETSFRHAVIFIQTACMILLMRGYTPPSAEVITAELTRILCTEALKAKIESLSAGTELA